MLCKCQEAVHQGRGGVRGTEVGGGCGVWTSHLEMSARTRHSEGCTGAGSGSIWRKNGPGRGKKEAPCY